ncbi:hypothetical protein [Flavobacterium sasangense]|nr:hypothetical protein [Flavobacterium sasangense]
MKCQCLTESLGFLNPPLMQAAKRYAIVYPSIALGSGVKEMSK